MRRRSIAILVIAASGQLSGIGCASETTVEDNGTEATGSSVESTLFEPTITTEPDGAATSTGRVFNFATPDDVRKWSVVNDTVMGGVSTGRLAWEDGALVFTGDLSLDNNGGFASVRSPFIDPTATEKWAGATGPIVELRGDGRAWTVEVRMDGEDGGWISDITTSTGEFAAVELPWASFEPVTRFLDPRDSSTPLDPSRIVSIAFYLVDGVEAPFRLEVRSVS